MSRQLHESMGIAQRTELFYLYHNVILPFEKFLMVANYSSGSNLELTLAQRVPPGVRTSKIVNSLYITLNPKGKEDVWFTLVV